MPRSVLILPDYHHLLLIGHIPQYSGSSCSKFRSHYMSPSIIAIHQSSLKKTVYTQRLIDAHIIQTRDAVDPMIKIFHLFIYAALRHPPIPLIEGLHSVPSPMSKWLSGRRAAREQRRGSSSVPPSHP